MAGYRLRPCSADFDEDRIQSSPTFCRWLHTLPGSKFIYNGRTYTVVIYLFLPNLPTMEDYGSVDKESEHEPESNRWLRMFRCILRNPQHTSSAVHHI